MRTEIPTAICAWAFNAGIETTKPKISGRAEVMRMSDFDPESID